MRIKENKNIEDLLNLKIIFPNNQEVIYCVDVIKYWEFTEEFCEAYQF